MSSDNPLNDADNGALTGELRLTSHRLAPAGRRFRTQTSKVKTGADRGPAAIFLPESVTLLGGTHDGVAMVRALCLAVLCLLFLGAALALMPGSRALPEDAAPLPPDARVSTIADVGAYSFVVNTSSKADKLSIASAVDTLAKVPVETIKITPVEVEMQPQPKSAPSRSEVVGWHWHAGSKIKRRTNP